MATSVSLKALFQSPISLHMCIIPDAPPPPAASATRQGLTAGEVPPHLANHPQSETTEPS